MRGRKMSAEFFVKYNRSIIAIPRRVFLGYFYTFFFTNKQKLICTETAFNGIVKRKKKCVLDNCSGA